MLKKVTVINVISDPAIRTKDVFNEDVSNVLDTPIGGEHAIDLSDSLNISIHNQISQSAPNVFAVSLSSSIGMMTGNVYKVSSELSCDVSVGKVMPINVTKAMASGLVSKIPSSIENILNVMFLKKYVPPPDPPPPPEYKYLIKYSVYGEDYLWILGWVTELHPITTVEIYQLLKKN